MRPGRVRFADHQALPLDGKRLARLLDFALGRLGLEGPVSLALVDDARIEDLNRRFKGHGGPTDVLAFPLREDGDPDPDPELGEIVVSADTAARQAGEEGHPFEREVALLALHGLLHLAGFDDASASDRRAMLEKGEALLEAFEGGEKHRSG